MNHCRRLMTIIFGIVMMGLMGTAQASFHTPAERAKTKLVLTSAVETICAVGSIDCALLRTASHDLYTDPLVVTQQDLARIDTLKSVLARYDAAVVQDRLSSARVGLAEAVARAEALTIHVLFLHDGKWEDLDVCTMPS